MELRRARGRGALGFEVRSVRRGSPAASIGIKRGDLLLGINGAPLSDEAALRSAILGLRGQARALVVVQRRGARYHVTLPLQ